MNKKFETKIALLVFCAGWSLATLMIHVGVPLGFRIVAYVISLVAIFLWWGDDRKANQELP